MKRHGTMKAACAAGKGASELSFHAQVNLHPCRTRSGRRVAGPLHPCGNSSGIRCQMLRHDAPHAALNEWGLRRMPGACSRSAGRTRAGGRRLPARRAVAAAREGNSWGNRDEEIEEEARDAGYGFASDEDEDALPPYDSGGGDHHGLGMSDDSDYRF